ncbi:unnamed protein product [Peniophora sp. CBMAI 1063]|nr:unnamed protein product [Peniophora sp. CBMAI 1063]
MSSIKESWMSLIETRFNVEHLRGSSADFLGRHLPSLDDELLYMSRGMAIARRRRNMFTAACRIPAEVLSSIFTFSAQSGWSPSRRPRGRFDYGWMYITHVCAYWREVAIGTASLWTNHPDCLDLPTEIVPHVVHRARNLRHGFEVNTYDVEVDLGKQLMSAWASSVPFGSHVQSLTLAGNEEGFEIVRQYVQQPMNGLEELAVEMEDLENVVEVFCLPDDLCPSAVRLAKLTLWGCLPRQWNTDVHLLRSSLTHLTIYLDYGKCADEELYPDYEEFVQVLLSMINLRSLKLENFFPYLLPLSPGERPRNPVFLPYVDYIGIAAQQRYHDALCLVPLLLHPPSTCVEVTVLVIGGDEREFHPERAVELMPLLDPAVTALYAGGETAPCELAVGLRDLHFHKTELPRSSWMDKELRRYWPKVISRSHDTPPRDMKGSAFMSVSPVDRCEAELSEPFRLCRRFLSLPLPNITAISLTHDAVIDLTHMKFLNRLVAAPSVRCLGIDIQSSDALLDILARHADGGGFEIFPLLEIIHFHTGGDKALHEAAYVRQTRALSTLVATRKNGGTPLRELMIEQALVGWRVWAAIFLDVPVTVLD